MQILLPFSRIFGSFVSPPVMSLWLLVGCCAEICEFARRTTPSRSRAPCLHSYENLFFEPFLALCLSRTDVVIETQQRATEFLVALHNDPDFGADAFVDELYLILAAFMTSERSQLPSGRSWDVILEVLLCRGRETSGRSFSED
jgi:hypothetical protein